MKEIRAWSVFQDGKYDLEYTDINSRGPIPLDRPYFDVMKSSLDLNWHNVLLLAIL